MKLIKPSFEILAMTGIDLIEQAGRTCYKSEDKITKDSAEKFVKMLDERKHHAMLEHSFASARVICDRGVTHEIVRHRLFSYAQESTRYCNYSKDKFDKQCTYIIPNWLNIPEGEYTASNRTSDGQFLFYRKNSEHEFARNTDFDNPTLCYLFALLEAEEVYNGLTNTYNWTAQQARAVLPNSLKTEIVISGNFREWKHFFSLRTAKEAHPQMQEIAVPIAEEFEKRVPAIKWR